MGRWGVGAKPDDGIHCSKNSEGEKNLDDKKNLHTVARGASLIRRRRLGAFCFLVIAFQK